MATGRTLEKWTRVYSDGYDVSGFGRSFGPLELTYDEHDLTATMSDTVKGYLPGHAQVNCGVFNAVFDNTATTGIHTVLQTAGGTRRTLIIARGIRGAPAAGDPAFCGQFKQSGYQVVGDGAVTVTVPFSGWAADAASLLYAGAWGNVLHPSGAETAANTGTGFDNPTAAATAKGGYLVYQLLTSNAAGTATISVDDSADNSTFAALSGATSGAIGYASIPTAGLVAIGNTATVRRYLRFQVALAGGMTTVTFVSAFVRAY